MVDQVANFKKVTVSTGYNNTATSIVLATGQGAELPDPSGDNYNLVWWDSTNYPDPADDPNVEVVRVTAKTTDTLTVTRNQESSGASAKNNADATYKMILPTTAKTITDLIADVEKVTTVIVGKSGHVDYLTTDYGSDDACIQAAIDYVSGLGKGTVVIREGDYIPAAKIDLASNVDMFSVGAKLTLPNSASHAMFDGSNKSLINIKGFQFYGNATNSATGRGLYFGGGNKILIEKNYFTDFGGDCIFGNSILDSTIQNNRFYDFGYYGIHLYADATRVNILNNHLRLCTLHEPIEVYGDTGNIASQILVANNNIQDANGANCAIHFKVNVQYSQIVNNVIKGCQYHGILLTDADYNDVNDNNILNVSLAGSGGYNGVTIAGSSNHNDASHNNVYQEYPAVVAVRYKHAVGEFDTADYNKISNNMCFGQLVPAGTQIAKVGANTTITSNNGHNPVGNFTAPSVPATTVNYTNAYGYPCQVQVYGGTVTEIDIDDIATSLTSGIFIIPPGGTINITYSAAPSWRWWGL